MSKPTAILGLNAWHGDAAACLLIDGVPVAAAEEERFRRVKHWAGFPVEAARWCLDEAQLSPYDLDWIAIDRDPAAARFPRLAYAVGRRPGLAFLRDRLRNRRRVRGVLPAFAEAVEADPGSLRARVAHVEHHRAHLASAFYTSPFDRAALVSVDGFGDFSSVAWGRGGPAGIRIRDRVRFPHSLGVFYLALTQYLGFPRYGDEYKVMGLSALGKPRFGRELEEVLRLRPRGRFVLGLEHFCHHTDGVEMEWEDGEPRLGHAFGPLLEELLGPARGPEDPLEERHADIAASVQARYEEAFFHVLRHVARRTGETRLCLAGGCAMNALANGRVRTWTPFTSLWVPPAPGDAGGALGAALELWCERLGGERPAPLRHAYLGPRFGNAAIRALLEREGPSLRAIGAQVRRAPDAQALCTWTAERIAAGGVVGWFQGRMEWGPRALGNRSILADPRRADVRELLNAKIKLRESFRPFAPSILASAVGAWFEESGEAPFMLEVRRIRPERRAAIPAVVHADGTGRLQTVDRGENPLYHRLIRTFGDLTGVPLLLNTSFNENEPVVLAPEEALACFQRTGMDALVLGNWFVERSAA